MSQSNESSKITWILSFLAGAVAGGLLVALNTHKPDLDSQGRAKALARCSKRGLEAVAKDVDGLMKDWEETSCLQN